MMRSFQSCVPAPDLCAEVESPSEPELLCCLQMVLELEPLDSGPSIEVTGRLHERRQSFQAHSGHQDKAVDGILAGSKGRLQTLPIALSREFTYKLLDGGVRFSPSA